MKKLLMLTAAVFALQAMPAMAQDGHPPEGKDGKKGPRYEKMFEEQDTNKDGKVSADEFAAFNKNRFDEIDANKDGSVTKEEAKTHHDAMKAKWKEKRDEMKKLKADEAPKE